MLDMSQPEYSGPPCVRYVPEKKRCLYTDPDEVHNIPGPCPMLAAKEDEEMEESEEEVTLPLRTAPQQESRQTYPQEEHRKERPQEPDRRVHHREHRETEEERAARKAKQRKTSRTLF